MKIMYLLICVFIGVKAAKYNIDTELKSEITLLDFPFSFTLEKGGTITIDMQTNMLLAIDVIIINSDMYTVLEAQSKAFEYLSYYSKLCDFPSIRRYSFNKQFPLSVSFTTERTERLYMAIINCNYREVGTASGSVSLFDSNGNHLSLEYQPLLHVFIVMLLLYIALFLLFIATSYHHWDYVMTPHYLVGSSLFFFIIKWIFAILDSSYMNNNGDASSVIKIFDLIFTLASEGTMIAFMMHIATGWHFVLPSISIKQRKIYFYGIFVFVVMSLIDGVFPTQSMLGTTIQILSYLIKFCVLIAAYFLISYTIAHIKHDLTMQDDWEPYYAHWYRIINRYKNCSMAIFFKSIAIPLVLIIHFISFEWTDIWAEALLENMMMFFVVCVLVWNTKPQPSDPLIDHHMHNELPDVETVNQS